MRSESDGKAESRKYGLAGVALPLAVVVSGIGLIVEPLHLSISLSISETKKKAVVYIK